LFACETGCDLHVVHVSSAKGVRAVLDAEHLCRDGRPRISCETCPHYLALTDDDVQRLGAIAKCAPPLRSASESDALWQQVLNGSISLISSDHSPAPRSMKDSTDFFAVWGGIAGVQSTLNVLLTRQPALPLQRIAQLTAGVPASLFNIAGKGRLAVGCDADLTLVELGPQFTLQRKDLLDRHKLSPYVGRTFTGVVRRTLLRGKTIFADGKLSGPPHGRLIKPLRASVAPPTDQGA
jgi:allantoinase